MVFNSIQFVVFFAVVYGAYRILPHRAQNWLLLVSSYVFYAAWDWRFLSLLIASTVVDYAVARYLDALPDGPRRRRVLWISIGFNLGVLGFFKYFNFFAESFDALMRWFGVDASLPVLHVVLPIGISFYTFQSMSYVIDVYRREIPPTRNLLEFAVFVVVLPAPGRRADPARADAAAADLVSRAGSTASRSSRGRGSIVWGLFKKVVVADNLATVVNAVFAQGDVAGGLEVLMAIYAFAFQIYGDFSGYTDIARGIVEVHGLRADPELPLPLLRAISPQEFWRRWHISLSTWLRDYLYIPLGGNRGGTAGALPEPDAHDDPRRPLARRRVDVRLLGHLPGRAAGDLPVGRRAAVGASMGRLAGTARVAGRRLDADVPPDLLRLAPLPRRSASQIASMTGALLTGWTHASLEAPHYAHAAALLRGPTRRDPRVGGLA